MEINININNQNINETYNEKLAEARKKVYGSSIAKELELAAIADSRYKQICDKMTDITGKPVWEDFNFHTGKIFGILRSIIQNPKQRKQLLEAIGLNDAIVDMYFKYCGNLPYVDNQNIINYGRPMNIEKTKEFIPIVGAMLGILVEDNDLDDITQERWDKLYSNALKRAEETAEFNLNNKEEEYEE